MDRDGDALRWTWRVMGRDRARVAVLTLVQALHGASGVLYALLLRGVVDAAVAHDAPSFWHWLALAVALVGAQLALRAAVRWLDELAKSSLENRLKRRLLGELLRRDYARVSAVHSGEWMNRLTNDAKVVADGCVEIVPGLAGMVAKLVGALALVIVLEPRLAAVLIPGGIAMLACTGVFRRVLKRLHRQVQEADGRLRVFLQERLGGMLTVRSFAAEPQVLAEAGEWMGEHQAARMRRSLFSNLCNVGFGAAMGGMRLAAVGWCGYGILNGTMSFGTLTAITQLTSQIQAPFANITGYLPRAYAVLASAERLMEAEGFEGDGPEALAPLAPAEVAAFYGERFVALGLRDVSFAYRPAAGDGSGWASAGDTADQAGAGGGSGQARPGAGDGSGQAREGVPVTLDHLSLEVRKGEYVALTGHSGCGKSTALKLLMCVYEPDAGERYLAGLAGERLPLTGAWRRLFAYVPQGNQLMGGTVREVVSLADPAAAHDGRRLAQALEVACADAFVNALADGVDTTLGERGAGLSEGQMQRLAIARAIFSQSPVLLLDEATSALDGATEARLLRNLRDMTDRTVVVVTHRPAALEICDRVLRFSEEGVEEL